AVPDLDLRAARDQITLDHRLPDDTHRVRAETEEEVRVAELASRAVLMDDVVLEDVAGDPVAVPEGEPPGRAAVAVDRIVVDPVVLRRLRVAVRFRRDAFVDVVEDVVAADDVPSALRLHAGIVRLV